MKTSTNAITKRWAESNGWVCETVQRFYGGRRHDLFGFVDSIILTGGGRPIFVQNCSHGSLAAHRAKVDAVELLKPREFLLRTGAALWLVEWRHKKAKAGWFMRQQTRHLIGWGTLTDWDGPYDLYPRKKKA